MQQSKRCDAGWVVAGGVVVERLPSVERAVVDGVVVERLSSAVVEVLMFIHMKKKLRGFFLSKRNYDQI